MRRSRRSAGVPLPALLDAPPEFATSEPTIAAARHLDGRVAHAHQPGTAAIAAATDDLRRLAWCLAREDGGDDLVQDTLVAALSSDPPRPDRVRAWLRQVMRNELRMRVRRDRRRHARERAAVVDAEVPSLDDVATHAELVDALHDALDGLADPYRAVLRARFLHGRAPAEISRELGAAPATVRWQIHEGLRRIRHRLDERYGDRQRWCGGAVALAAWPGHDVPRATGATMMTKLALMQWMIGGGVAASGLALAIGYAPAREGSSTATAATAATNTAQAEVQPPSPTTNEPLAVSAFVGADAVESTPQGGADGACDGECDAPQSTRSFTSPMSDDCPLARLFAACEHLVPEDQRDGRFEIRLEIAGGPPELGNSITGATVTRGRKIPCLDPDAGFDEVDGPDVIHFAAVAECIEHSAEPDLIEPLPEGEQRGLVVVLGDETLDRQRAQQDDWKLPAPSAKTSTLDPEQAIAALSVPQLWQHTTDEVAPVSVIECGGYDCTFCQRARKTLAQLEEQYGDAISLHFLQLPLPMHPTAALAARAAIAADAQGRLAPMHEALFDHPEARSVDALVELARAQGLDAERFREDLLSDATAQTVADEADVCQRAGAHGTPSFFINGDLLVGSQAIEAFREVIDDELAQAR